MFIHSFKSVVSYIVLIAGLSTSAFVSIAGATGTASKISVSSGNNQTELVGTTLPVAYVVRVTDSSGNPVSGATVKWAVTGGNGTLAVKSATTNASGVVSDTLTLGTIAGMNQVTATIPIGAQIIFGSVGTPRPGVSIGLSSGNGQTGTVGAVLPKSLAVLCRDKYGNNASHTQVDWVAGRGGDSFPYESSTTDGGIATHPLTLGTVPGVDTATATIKGTKLSYTFTETAVAGPASIMTISSGNDQEGVAHAALATPLTVKVTDAHGNRLSGLKVDWSANTAGDSLSSSSAITTSQGHASDTLTLGSTFGVHTATATLAGTKITQTFVETEGADVVVTTQTVSDPNPHALQPYFLGLSYPTTWVGAPLFNVKNAAIVALFKKLGPGVVRFVAEQPLDPVIWDPTGPGLQYGTVAPPDIARVAAFLKAVNWKVLYGIALVNNTPAAAANEAAVAAKEFGSNLLGFEIGNEPDRYNEAMYGDPAVPQLPGYTWQDYMSTSSVYAASGKLIPSWPVFANAIRAAVSNAPLTGPTSSFTWAIDFAQSGEASKVSLLTRHYYAKYPAELPTMTELLSPDPRVADEFPELAQAATAANISGGYRISECNSVSGTVPGLGDGFGAALWTIDFLFENAAYHSTGVNFNGGGYGPGNYSPIRDNAAEVIGIGPDYYGLFAYALLAKGGTILSTQVTPAPSTFSAYAVEQTDGHTDFILSNKDPDNSITVAVRPQSAISEATSLLLTAPSLTATSGFELGGSPIKTDGNWEAASNPALPITDGAAVVTVPAGSAQIVHLQ